MLKKGEVSRNFGKYQKIGNLKSMMTLTVTSRGDSLCIIIPKDLVDVSEIISGDKVRVWFLDLIESERLIRRIQDRTLSC